ncbi:MAG: ComF family protein [Pseudomonadota bacterium]
MTLASDLRAGLSPLVDLVYPPRCPLCGVAIAAHGGLCSECWSALEAPPEPGCSACGRPMTGSDATDGKCWQCSEEMPRHCGVIAPTIYNDASRDLLLRFKHGGKITLAKLMARMMAGRLNEAKPGEGPLLIPVPLHRSRLWTRGYNQAALLASELAKLGKGELRVDALERAKRTPSLGGLGREARQKALDRAIVVRPGHISAIRGRDVLLVDDVYTSGATSGVCTAALLDGGARSVTIVCFAQVIDGRSV